MNNPSILNQPIELLIKQILYLNSNEISHLKLVNKEFFKIIKNNESYIYKKQIQKEYGELMLQPYILFHCMKYKINIQDFQNQHCFKNILRQIVFSSSEATIFIFSKIFKINSVDQHDNSMLIYLLSNIERELPNSLFKYHILTSNDDYSQINKDFFNLNISNEFYDTFDNEEGLDIDHVEKTVINKIKILLNANPNVKIENKSKQSAIIYACRFCKDIEIIKKIIELGGDIYKRDIYGWNAIMYAYCFNEEVFFYFFSNNINITESDLIIINSYQTHDTLIKILIHGIPDNNNTFNFNAPTPSWVMQAQERIQNE